MEKLNNGENLKYWDQGKADKFIEL